MKTVTIAILTHNGKEYLSRSLASILEQQQVDFEVLILDNGSDKETRDYLLSVESSLVRVINHPQNDGYSKGKNLLVSKVNTPFVLLLDDDIVLPSRDSLFNLVNFYKKLGQVAFLSPLLVDEGKLTTRYYGIAFRWYGMNIFRRPIKLTDFYTEKDPTRIGAFHGGAVFFEKKVWDELGGYDDLQPMMLDDFDLGSRAYLFGYKNYLYTGSALIHIGKMRDDSKVRFARKFRYYYSGFATTILKNYSLKRVIVVLPSFTLISFMLMGYLTVSKLNPYIPFAFLSSYALFLRNLPLILRRRKQTQLYAKDKTDAFEKN